MMITKDTSQLMIREISKSKKASIVVGVVTKDGRFIEGFVQNQMPKINVGDLFFEIGSTTKTFTSLLLAKLVTEGKISLDDPVSHYKPVYKNALSYNGKEITFRHLATHTSRLPREDMKTIRKNLKENKQEKNNPYKSFTSDHLHQFYIDFDLKKEIGTKWGYSNIGIGLLGNILAELEKFTYEEAIQKYILEPFQMKDTFITVGNERMDRYVKAYDKKGKRVPPIELPAIDGAGAIKSTVNDMLTYLEHQIGLRDSPLAESIALTHERQNAKAFKRLDMGLCWMIEDVKWSKYPIYHHGGTTIGFHTYCGFMKEREIGIVIFSTVQIPLLRFLRMIVGLEDMVNTNIANQLFEKHDIFERLKHQKN